MFLAAPHSVLGAIGSVWESALGLFGARPQFPAEGLKLAGEELFGDPREVSIALKGIQEGWGRMEMERQLGPDKMTLLVRQQMADSNGILAHRWHRRGATHLTRVFARSLKDYSKIRSRYSLGEIACMGRSFPRLTIRVGQSYVPFPFVAFRHFSSPATPLFYYGEAPCLMLAKWPRALVFDPEPFLEGYFQIEERWVLGGIPDDFILFRGERGEVERTVQESGGVDLFFEKVSNKF